MNPSETPQFIESDIAALLGKVKWLEERLQFAEEEIRLLRLARFTPKSEAYASGQGDLFNEVEEVVTQAEPPQDNAAGGTLVPEHTRGRPKRKCLPDNLPEVLTTIDIPDSEKFCPRTGLPLKCIGTEVSRVLDMIPAKIQILRTERCKYACTCCEVEGTQHKVAPLPPQAIPRSMASAGLLAAIITSKYVDALPLYRQEQILQRSGIEIPRNTMAEWVIRCAALAEPVLERMQKYIFSSPVIFCDETPVQVLKGTGKAATAKSYMWTILRNGANEDQDRAILYHYDPSRSKNVPLKLFEGFAGYLHTDGYGAYDCVSEKYPGISHVGCWAHTRRKFFEARKIEPASVRDSLSDHALKEIRKLYMIERELLITSASPDEILAVRQSKSRPIVDEFRKWMTAQLAKVAPKSAVGKALRYADRQWAKLVKYLDDPRLGLDTNPVENAIRPFVTGRKNWMFSDVVKGAKASAALYSLAITCRLNGLNPFDYFKRLFEELPKATTSEEIDNLVPWMVKPKAQL